MVISGDTVQMAGGFPTAQWNATFYALVNDSGRFDTGGTDVCTADWCTRGNVGSLVTVISFSKACEKSAVTLPLETPELIISAGTEAFAEFVLEYVAG